jgi:hypothetical protein
MHGNAAGRAAAARRAITANTGGRGHGKCHIANSKVSRDHKSADKSLPSAPFDPEIHGHWAISLHSRNATKSRRGRIRTRSCSRAPPPPHQASGLSSVSRPFAVPVIHLGSSVPSARWQLLRAPRSASAGTGQA